VAERHGVDRVYDSLAELLADDDVAWWTSPSCRGRSPTSRGRRWRRQAPALPEAVRAGRRDGQELLALAEAAASASP
jgi:hypothetical protein